MNFNYSVKPILRTDKGKGNIHPINYRITIDRKTLKLPSGETCEKSKWDAAKGLIKGKSDAKINKKLEKQVAAYREFLLDENLRGNFVTLEDFKRHFTNEGGKGFYDVIEEFKRKKFKDISDGTIGHYELVVRRLKEFKPKSVSTTLT